MGLFYFLKFGAKPCGKIYTSFFRSHEDPRLPSLTSEFAVNSDGERIIFHSPLFLYITAKSLSKATPKDSHQSNL